jgi:hypothetical protein
VSYDIDVWSLLPCSPEAFAKPADWEGASGSWHYARKGWPIVVYHSADVQPEDDPPEVSPLLAGICFLTHMHVEGDAPDQAIELATSTAKRIAQKTLGVVSDPQEGSASLPNGVKRFELASATTFDVVELNWWFLDGPLNERSGREALLDLMQRMLPKALPRRFGLSEPPANKFAEAGIAGFLDFLDQNFYQSTVWYTSRPVTMVHLNFQDASRLNKIGFRTNILTIGLEANAFSQPGWNAQIRAFWERASALIEPIYGDVRNLDGYFWRGGTVFRNHFPQRYHPVQSWFWKGIPASLGNAVVLGATYQKYWPEFVAKAQMIDGLAFVSTGDWVSTEDVSEILGRPPIAQTQIKRNLTDLTPEFPVGWPFAKG